MLVLSKSSGPNKKFFMKFKLCNRKTFQILKDNLNVLQLYFRIYRHLFVIRITNFFFILRDRDTEARCLELYTARVPLKPLNDKSAILQTHLIAPI